VKRFWKDVDVIEADGGWTVRLDQRPLLTPARAALVVPAKPLAEAIAQEWRAVTDEVDPRAMRFTGLANAAIDRVAPDRLAFANGLARYAEADLACYRSDWPPELVDRQAEQWDALLAWARRRYDVDFCSTSGLVHVPQPQATIERLAHAVAALDAFHLAGLSPMVTIGGSLVAGLAVLEHAVSPEAGWDAVSVDERFQLEHWGEDSEAKAALDNRQTDFLSAARFAELLES
jgi:chaperone required for assembly of F1-ATPase